MSTSRILSPLPKSVSWSKNSFLISSIILVLHLITSLIQIFSEKWISELEIQVIEFIFACLLFLPIVFFVYTLDFPEWIAQFFALKEFLSPSDPNLLEKSRKFYALLAGVFFFLGWSLNSLLFHFSLLIFITFVISILSLFYILQQISKHSVNQIKLPTDSNYSNPFQKIRQSFTLLFISGFLGVIYTNFLVVVIYFYQRSHRLWNPPYELSSEAYPGFISTPSRSQFWKRAYLNAILLHLFCFSIIFLPFPFLVHFPVNRQLLLLLSIWLIIPTGLLLFGYIVVDKKVRLFGSPQRRLFFLFLEFSFQIITIALLNTYIFDLLPLSRLSRINILLLPDLLLSVFLFLSPFLQFYGFFKQAVEKLQFHSRKSFLIMFFFYSLSVIALEVLLSLMFIVPITFPLFARFGLGLGATLIICNLFILPPIGRLVWRKYSKLVKKNRFFEIS